MRGGSDGYTRHTTPPDQRPLPREGLFQTSVSLAPCQFLPGVAAGLPSFDGGRKDGPNPVAFVRLASFDSILHVLSASECYMDLPLTG